MSRTGLVVGILLGLLLARATYNTNAEYDTYTGRQELGIQLGHEELQPVYPTHPAKEKIESYVCAYRSGYCFDEFIDTTIRWSDSFGINPYLLVAIAVWEAPRYPNHGSYCNFGYASCAKRFATIDLEVFTVVSTLYKYGGSDWYKLSVWHTGSGYDTTGYPERVLQTANNIKGL